MTKERGKVNINQTIWKVIQSDLAVQKDLARKIINMRALAKYLIKKYGLTFSLDGVISAIRRFQGQEDFKEDEESLLHIFKESVVSTRNNVASITVSMGAKEFFSKMCALTNHFNFRLAIGENKIKLIVDNLELDKAKKMFSQEEVQKVEEGLSEITVKVSETALQTKGVLARISSELALANINISEIVICPPEFFIYVKQKDIVKAHDSILRLIQG